MNGQIYVSPVFWFSNAHLGQIDTCDCDPCPEPFSCMDLMEFVSGCESCGVSFWIVDMLYIAPHHFCIQCLQRDSSLRQGVLGENFRDTGVC